MADVNYYKADLREIEFSLFEQFRLGDVLGKAPYNHMSAEDAHMILKEAYTFATEVVGPTMKPSDQAGVRLDNGQPHAPKELKAVWKQYYAAGWNTLTMSQANGGQGAPQLLGVAVLEMMSGANTAFHMYPGLTAAAAAVIRAAGTAEQRELYAPRLEDGSWCGTMVLTEPQAGSDVGLSRAKAVPNADGTFAISGQKIFISSGDHDLTENIIHLALARIEGAPKGTRGLSLFIVPKFRVNPDGSLGEPNDVVCTHLEHKLGIHASATAALSFGDNGKCVGYLLGADPARRADAAQGTAPGEGMKKMFLMMNTARIGVGVQSLGLASTAYFNALAYARTRLQGAHPTKGRGAKEAVPIIEHADVRRMLMEMKSLVEGCRALIYSSVKMQDEAAQLRAAKSPEAAEVSEYMGLFIPLVKGFVSDAALRVASTALQVYGGHGYLQDHPVEQYFRDARIFPIYEGTNGIQALDLVGRKLGAGGGKYIGRFIKECGDLADTLKARPDHAREGELFARGVAALNGAVGKYLEYFTQGKTDLVLVTATRFMDVMAHVLISKLLLEAALLAEGPLAKAQAGSQDAQFYQGKIASARFFVRNLLPVSIAHTEVIAAGDATALEVPDGGFSLAF
jgi:hypothetical protein